MRSKAFFLILFLLFGISLFTMYKGTQYSLSYTEVKSAYAEELSFQNRLLNVKEWMPWSKDQKERMNRAKEIANEAEKQNTSSAVYATLTGICALLALLLAVVMGMGTAMLWLYLTFACLAMGISCLIGGIAAPMLEISALKNDLNIPARFEVLGAEMDFSKTFEGEMFFYYQSKSVLGLISLLLQKGNALVAFAIFAFSIFIPFCKLLLTIASASSKRIAKMKAVAFVINNLGKWSMADVFVAATFLAYLSFNNMQAGIETESNSMIGLYLFFGYCMLSLLSSVFFSKYHKENQ